MLHLLELQALQFLEDGNSSFELSRALRAMLEIKHGYIILIKRSKLAAISVKNTVVM